MMRLAILQPYFLPYIGYFQLIELADVFVIYDNVKYTKKGWINRNRMLQNGSDVTFSLPLKKDSHLLTVAQRKLAADFDRTKLLNKFRGAYVRAPFFSQTYQLLQRIINHADDNLFRYVYHSVIQTCMHLGISTEILISSDIEINHDLKGQDKVVALCQALGAKTYINSIGGMNLYSRKDFKSCGIDLQFIKSKHFEYAQFGSPFSPWLSIVDILMFNAPEQVDAEILSAYEIIVQA